MDRIVVAFEEGEVEEIDIAVAVDVTLTVTQRGAGSGEAWTEKVREKRARVIGHSDLAIAVEVAA
jgi:hypothetical protein